MKKSILIVEDDEHQRAMFTHALTMAGYQVVAASNGTEALRQALTGPFDLLLTDLYLPECQGDLLIREIKLRQPSIKAVLMSCHRDLPEAAQLCQVDGMYRKDDLHQLMALLFQLVAPQTLVMQ